MGPSRLTHTHRQKELSKGRRKKNKKEARFPPPETWRKKRPKKKPSKFVWSWPVLVGKKRRKKKFLFVVRTSHDPVRKKKGGGWKIVVFPKDFLISAAMLFLFFFLPLFLLLLSLCSDIWNVTWGVAPLFVLAPHQSNKREGNLRELAMPPNLPPAHHLAEKRRFPKVVQIFLPPYLLLKGCIFFLF